MDEKISLLQQIFENVNSWLHFAEAKNAALIAFNVALLTAVISSDFYGSYTLLLSIIIIGLLSSTIFAIYSFKPINKRLGKSGLKGIEDNLLHFAYIASLDRDEYIQKIYEYYWKESNMNINDVSRLEKDYCEEIIDNARIAMRKQKYFGYGFRIVLLTIIIIGILVICA